MRPGQLQNARTRPSWAGRNYLLLTGATVIANLGSSGALIATAFAVLAAGGSATDVGLVAAARTIPLVLFLLIGGAVADRLPRHHVMVAANALSCISQGLFAWLALAGALRAFLDVRAIPARAAGGGILHDLRDGWREVASRPWLWAVVVQFSIVNAVVSAAEAVYGPLVAEEHLGGPGPWGLALAAFGAGTAIGALLMTRIKPRRLLLTGALCVFPLALPSAALAVPLPAAGLTALMFGTGIAIEVFSVTWMMALHQEIPEEKFSRVSSYDWLGSVSMIPLATALAGPVQNLIGRTAALWSCSALIALLTAAVLCVPDIRRLTRRTTPPLSASPSTPSPASPAPITESDKITGTNNAP